MNSNETHVVKVSDRDVTGVEPVPDEETEDQPNDLSTESDPDEKIDDSSVLGRVNPAKRDVPNKRGES